MRSVWEVGNLRAKRPFAVVRGAIRDSANTEEGFRIVHFSVQPNHLHLIVEATDERVLGRGMQRLAIRIARRINKLLRRRGTVFSDRYHRHDLKGPRETRNGLAYVLQNFRKHEYPRGRTFQRGWIDACSSGPWFRGWSFEAAMVARHENEPSPVIAPKTWVLRVGWTKFGLISPDEVPGLRRAKRGGGGGGGAS